MDDAEAQLVISLVARKRRLLANEAVAGDCDVYTTPRKQLVLHNAPSLLLKWKSDFLKPKRLGLKAVWSLIRTVLTRSAKLSQWEIEMMLDTSGFPLVFAKVQALLWDEARFLIEYRCSSRLKFGN